MESHPAPSALPLIEAVIAFQFGRNSQPWDSIFFGKMHDRLQDVFPNVETLLGTQIIMGGANNPPALQPAPEIKRFSSADGGFVATIGPDTLGVSIIARKVIGPYPGWPVLQRRALDLLQTYFEVTKPDGIKTIGVRYINSIAIEPATFVVRRYLSAESGFVPAVLLDETAPFAFRIEQNVKGTFSRREVLNVIARPTPGPPDAQGELIVDIDEICIPSSEQPQINVSDVSDELHIAVWSIFRHIFSKEFFKTLDINPSVTETGLP